jgi:glycosyltransferase involved in cell wall biosynthesis
MNSLDKITFVLIVKNAEISLQDTLEAIKNCPNILVYDNGSQDNTQAIVLQYPKICFYQGTFEGFGPTRNKAAKMAKTPWVFHLDADEVPSKKLLEELTNLKLDSNCVYSILRDNYFWNKAMKGCSGWSSDIVTRLYPQDKTSYSQDLVHEKVLSKGFGVIKLTGTLKHTPYPSLSSMMEKMEHYSTLFCKNTKKKAHALSPFTHGIWAFIKSYIFKKGIFQGYRGYILSKYIADTAFYKYLKLYEFTKK